jgi:antitoxin FitA
MASLTIRNLDESLKGRLRVRAASSGHSMEEEARRILRAALVQAQLPDTDLGRRIRRRFANLGDVELPIADREAVREPPLVPPSPARGEAAKTAPARRKRRN